MKKGYELDGSAIERHIIDTGRTGFEENYVTEIIIPIKIQNSF